MNTDDKWYYKSEGKNIGPISLIKLLQAIDEGLIGPDTETRQEAGVWIAASKNQTLFEKASQVQQSQKVTQDRSLEKTTQVQQKSSNEWYYKQAGKDIGPVSSQQLVEAVISGAIISNTKVRRGSKPWILASQVEGLFERAAKGNQTTQTTQISRASTNFIQTSYPEGNRSVTSSTSAFQSLREISRTANEVARTINYTVPLFRRNQQNQSSNNAHKSIHSLNPDTSSNQSLEDHYSDISDFGNDQAGCGSVENDSFSNDEFCNEFGFDNSSSFETDFSAEHNENSNFSTDDFGFEDNISCESDC